ncbi:hypothetical protein SCLCIDRAFT_132064, partial [Scleroderma citrinum Foug A]
HFCSNSSEMKKMVARDFEDLLLCTIPVFDKLLPEPHNTSVTTLLFLLCHWHGLAKLHMHTDDMLELMESVTVSLGNHLRVFTTETCTAFSTKELCCETEAQIRHHGHESNHRISSSHQNNTQAASRKARTLNLQTYKLHALGDYVKTMSNSGHSSGQKTG